MMVAVVEGVVVMVDVVLVHSDQKDPNLGTSRSFTNNSFISNNVVLVIERKHSKGITTYLYRKL